MIEAGGDPAECPMIAETRETKEAADDLSARDFAGLTANPGGAESAFAAEIETADG